MPRLALVACLCLVAFGDAHGQTVDDTFFERKIRPILVDHCQSCHGEKKQKSGLRLDTLQALLAGGESGPTLVPGKPDESLLVRVIEQGEPYAMPPKGKLPREQVASIRLWVKAGAPWPGATTGPNKTATTNSGPNGQTLWSFQSPRQASPPTVKDEKWCRSPIDRFLLAELEAKGLKPAPEADRRTLLRRVSFDLTGLPPTPRELEEFEADRSPDAFERVVNRLLASPAYGERWGRHWLDLARYADSNGMDENMAHANAFRYRDWVIDALNRDLPYDQFVTHQIAGDLVPTPDADERARRITATGFLVIGPKMLAEDDPQKMEMDIVDEQLDTLGKTFLGMTFGCARCHDHKFDPISTADYYGMAAILKSTKTMANFKVVAMWHERPVPGTEILAKRTQHGEALAQSKKQLEDRLKLEKNLLAADVAKNRRALDAAWKIRAQQQSGIQAKPIMADGKAPPPKTILLEAEKFDRGNLVRDFTTYGPGIGVVYNAGTLPNVAEYDFQVHEEGIHQIEVRHAAAESRPVRLILDGQVVKGDAAGGVTGSWTPESQRWGLETRVLLVEGKHTLKVERDGPVPHLDKIALVPRKDLKNGDLAATPLTVAEAARAEGLPAGLVEAWLAWLNREKKTEKPPEASITAVLKDAKGPLRSGKDEDRLFADPVQGDLKKLREAVGAAEKLVPPEPMAMAAEEGKPGNLKIHLRGNYLTLGQEVPRVFPRALAGEKQQPVGDKQSGRLELAQWMTRPDNPLTARVMVNRVWHWHFGGGLVRTPDNFGKLGMAPANQPLLDWLAVEFVRKGWSLKELHRLILGTSAYRMSCQFDETSNLADPDNKLFWRFNRQRLEAEALRDGIIAVSGDLDRKAGGTLLKTANHAYVASTASEAFDPYQVDRRSVYLPVIRSRVYEFLQAFDFADPSASNGERVATTVAPQALALLNSRLMEDKTRSWAEKLMRMKADSDRVEAIYRQALLRSPSPKEMERALAHTREIRPSLIGNERERELKSWQSICRVVLASSEFVHVD